ncbi:type 1 glutamine amidotransferase domain-containing protein [Flagellimonas hymeniacidonis]|uniref:Type 1 glutamine amidotransferase domain-containing protein n=1 Tax=Flagellimonas hymeniacidonis TaxID=2603628 RepID=A0A5C8V3H1_9FLAO|nr:type 1 glutamine amidotransferase domain-containing protein [Flagellimonas hymeniacidonis]TXN36120.1 type 1 glutamine amidotransferase domain-containing protein [Flagellimonas hymeniacidonis]
MKHILFIVTSASVTGTGKHPAGYEFSEIADPYYEFINKGYTVDFASILGGIPPHVGYNSSEKISKKFIESNGFKRLNFSHKLDDVNIDAYDAIFFPGGLGLMTDMVDNPLVKEIIKITYENEKVIGAVCHGPAALLNVKLSDEKNLLKGKKINSFTKAEEEKDKHILGDVIPFMLDEELIKQGAIFSHTLPFESYVINDGNIITGQNPASASRIAIEMIKSLE